MFDRRGLLAAGGAITATAALGARATRDPRLAGMVLGPGPAGRFDDIKVGIGVPRWDAANRRWLLWYYGRDKAFRADAASTLGSGRVGFATSRNFTDWNRVDGPGFGGSVLGMGEAGRFDSLHLGLCDVCRVGKDWYMWTFGGDEAPLDFSTYHLLGYRMRSGLARSRDGIHWTKLYGKAAGGALVDYRPDQTFAAWPNGLHDGQKFVLYYTVVDQPPPARQFRTFIAFSANGVDWEPQGEMRWLDDTRGYDSNGVMTRHVMPNPFPGPRWLMLYTALDKTILRSIAVAVSDDLLSWRRQFDAPIFNVGALTQWDGGGVSAPQLAHNDRTMFVSYYGFPTHDVETGLAAGVGAALVRDGDLRSLRRL